MNRIRAVVFLAALASPVAASPVLAQQCPPGFEVIGGRCDIKKECSYGMEMRNGQCVSATTCADGAQAIDGFCVNKSSSPSAATDIFHTPSKTK